MTFWCCNFESPFCQKLLGQRLNPSTLSSSCSVRIVLELPVSRSLSWSLWILEGPGCGHSKYVLSTRNTATPSQPPMGYAYPTLFPSIHLSTHSSIHGVTKASRQWPYGRKHILLDQNSYQGRLNEYGSRSSAALAYHTQILKDLVDS